MNTGKLVEASFNTQLAEALRFVKRKWTSDMVEPEHITRGKRTQTIDVRLTLDGVVLPIECEYDHNRDPAADALKQLKDNKEFNASIAVAIPKRFRELSNQEAL